MANSQRERLAGKTFLVTGGAQRIGRAFVLAIAQEGGHPIIHYGASAQQAFTLQAEIETMGQKADVLQADLQDPDQTRRLIENAIALGPLDGLINNAAIFEPLSWQDTTLDSWERHLAINLTAPFLLCQVFAQQASQPQVRRIINILDWRALRPGPDHFPYTIAKAALAAMTRSLAAALAPRICVNGLALGAILPPSDGAAADNILESVPARRWAHLDEVSEALIFLLTGPAYITGEILHIDGGRHLV